MTRGRIFPTWEQIKALKNPLTSGEYELAKFLDNFLPEEWEIYVQPFMNGDRPDIVILNPKIGLMIYEVKDWSPNLYFKKEVEYFDKKSRQKKKGIRYFVRDSRGEWPIPNPVAQVERYRENLINLYIPNIGEAVDRNTKTLSAFKVGIYFHKIKTTETKKLVDINPKRCVVFGYDNLGKNNIQVIVPDINRQRSLSMRRDWIDEIRFWLTPPFHTIEQGTKIILTPEQQRHVMPSPNSHQRLRGVVGSGKTLVLAQRAANIASQGKRVLIVTYNITLWHYIRDQVSRARISFKWDRIEFNHFHGFCRNYLKENDIPWPEQGNATDEEFLNEIIPNVVLENIRKGKNKKRRRYDAILIDEGQDYQKLWYEVLCEFLTGNDELLYVVDERQNIYRRDNSWIDAMRGVKFAGRWRELNKSYRLPPVILQQARLFAKKYLNNIGLDPEPNSKQLDFFNPNLIWRNLESFDEAKEKILIAINWLTKKKGIHPQDIVVLIPTHSEGWELVKLFEKHKIAVNHVFEDDNKSHHHKKSFWMGDSRLKMCTIHSFKGWELRNVIVLTPPDTYEEIEDLDKLFYIAITRSRQNLIIFNRHSRYKEYGEGWPNKWN